MRKGLRWALGLTVALTVAALVPSKRPPLVLSAARDSEGHRRSDVAQRGATDRVMEKEVATAWPEHLDPWTLDRARADIFSTALQAPVAPPPVPIAPQSVVAPLSPAPAAPPLTWRYLGRMVTPEGSTLVLLTRSDASVVSVQEGSKLEDGYEVLAVRPDAVRLIHLQSGAEVDVPITNPDAGP